LDNPEFGGVFQFIQEFQGYIWPGVVAAFVIAFVVPRAPGAAAVAALISGPVIYGLLQRFSGIHFLIQVLLAFVIVCAIMVVITLARPLQEPRQLPVRSDMQVENSRLAMGMGAIVIMAVVAFYCVFW
jgi:SSS family solute:Na+ symporter